MRHNSLLNVILFFFAVLTGDLFAAGEVKLVYAKIMPNQSALPQKDVVEVMARVLNMPEYDQELFIMPPILQNALPFLQLSPVGDCHPYTTYYGELPVSSRFFFRIAYTVTGTFSITYEQPLSSQRPYGLSVGGNYPNGIVGDGIALLWAGLSEEGNLEGQILTQKSSAALPALASGDSQIKSVVLAYGLPTSTGYPVWQFIKCNKSSIDADSNIETWRFIRKVTFSPGQTDFTLYLKTYAFTNNVPEPAPQGPWGYPVLPYTLSDPISSQDRYTIDNDHMLIE